MESEYCCNQVDIVYDMGLFKEPESLAVVGRFTEGEVQVNFHILASLGICHL